jgi:tRNA(Ile2) C34 agmatinyltransferase TiaS
MQGGNPKKPVKPYCAGCGVSLGSGSKSVINSLWHCARCTYIHDYPEKATEVVPRKRAAPLQEEKLFEIPARDDR